RWFGYLTAFSRLNRRMHNTSFTAVRLATVIGGRYVGVEYFDAANDMLFSALDVMAAGSVSALVSRDLDRYWQSLSFYPPAPLLAPATDREVADFAATVKRVETAPDAQVYLDSIRQSAFVQNLLEGTLPLEWVPTRMISDDPAKGLGLAQPE